MLLNHIFLQKVVYKGILEKESNNMSPIFHQFISLHVFYTLVVYFVNNADIACAGNLQEVSFKDLNPNGLVSIHLITYTFMNFRSYFVLESLPKSTFKGRFMLIMLTNPVLVLIISLVTFESCLHIDD